MLQKIFDKIFFQRLAEIDGKAKGNGDQHQQNPSPALERLIPSGGEIRGLAEVNH